MGGRLDDQLHVAIRQSSASDQPDLGSDQSPTLSDRLVDVASDRSSTVSDQLDVATQGSTSTNDELDAAELLRLAMDPEGYREFKNIIWTCSARLRRQIIVEIVIDKAMFLQVSTSKFGSTSMRKFIHIMKEEHDCIFEHIVRVTCACFFQLMTSKAGQHVAIDCFRATGKSLMALYNAPLMDHVAEIACDEVGCAALNVLIDEARGSTRKLLMNTIAESALRLAQDPYGNFVLQKVMDLHSALHTAMIILKLGGYYQRISFQKHGSYVVEKCLGTPLGVATVMKDLVECDEDLLRLAKNRYGNYVIQSTLKAAELLTPHLCSILVKKLLNLGEDLKFGYSRNIYLLIHGQQI